MLKAASCIGLTPMEATTTAPPLIYAQATRSHSMRMRGPFKVQADGISKTLIIVYTFILSS